MLDADLLHEYVSNQSVAAFRKLVERHLALVYSAALRQVGEPVLAENLTHVVFILLQRKSGQLSPETILPNWLFLTTRQAIAKSLPGDSSQYRSKQVRPVPPSPQTADLWEQVAPFFDETLAELSDGQRSAVLLHYFLFKRLAEVAVALGTNENSAQARVDRAVRSLRNHLLVRGVNVSLELLPGLLMTRGAPPAPSYLNESVIGMALNQGSVSTPVYALLQAAGRESVWPKINAGLRQAAVIAIIAGLTVHFWPRRTPADPSSYSFDTKIVMRPPYVEPVEWPPVFAATIPTTNQPPRTNTAPIAPRQVVAVRSPIAPTNITWVPVTPAAPVNPLTTASPDSGAASAVMQPPAADVPMGSFALSPPVYQAQNFFRIGAGFPQTITNTAIPWASAPRALSAIPARPAPSTPPRKR